MDFAEQTVAAYKGELPDPTRVPAHDVMAAAVDLMRISPKDRAQAFSLMSPEVRIGVVETLTRSELGRISELVALEPPSSGVASAVLARVARDNGHKKATEAALASLSRCTAGLPALCDANVEAAMCGGTVGDVSAVTGGPFEGCAVPIAELVATYRRLDDAEQSWLMGWTAQRILDRVPFYLFDDDGLLTAYVDHPTADMAGRVLEQRWRRVGPEGHDEFIARMMNVAPLRLEDMGTTAARRLVGQLARTTRGLAVVDELARACAVAPEQGSHWWAVGSSWELVAPATHVLDGPAIVLAEAEHEVGKHGMRWAHYLWDASGTVASPDAVKAMLAAQPQTLGLALWAGRLNLLELAGDFARAAEATVGMFPLCEKPYGPGARELLHPTHHENARNALVQLADAADSPELTAWLAGSGMLRVSWLLDRPRFGAAGQRRSASSWLPMVADTTEVVDLVGARPDMADVLLDWGAVVHHTRWLGDGGPFAAALAAWVDGLAADDPEVWQRLEAVMADYNGSRFGRGLERLAPLLTRP